MNDLPCRKLRPEGCPLRTAQKISCRTGIRMEGCCPVHQTSHYPAKNIFCHVSRKGQYIYKRVSRYLSAVTPLKTRMDCNLIRYRVLRFLNTLCFLWSGVPALNCLWRNLYLHIGWERKSRKIIRRVLTRWIPLQCGFTSWCCTRYCL